MSDDQRQRLKSQLWNIANVLRGKMNADDFRDYMLGFIFYKYLSERMEIYADKLLEPDGITYEELQEETAQGQAFLDAIKREAIDQLGYFLAPSELFRSIAERGSQKSATGSSFIIEDLDGILKNIETSATGTESEEDFVRLFEDLDLGSSKLGRTVNDKNNVVVTILSHLNQIDFRLDDTEADVLGDAYEYLIGEFAAGAGKKAGEFYTPQEVSRILAKLVTTGRTRLRSVYDPTCGSGSLLLRVRKEVEDIGHFYGQEQNRTTYNLARMNMLLHGVHYRHFDIQLDDTLETPRHVDMKFEAIVANPPFSAKWSSANIFLTDDRFSQYGRLAPSSKADFAFVQHMVHHLDENGHMACVLPHGALFRGAAEEHIRRYLIEDRNYIDAIIGLPANIFYGTGIPTCIMVIKKCREHPNDILFIDASQHFEKAKNQNRLGTEDIDRIVTTYQERKTVDKYSYVASLEEVEENEFNLNIPRYVDTFEEEEPVDLTEVSASIRQLQQKMQDVDAEIAGFCEELGIEAPM